MPPQTAAAIISAEAFTGRDGVWNPNSRNPGSTALGITQFNEGTWIGEAQRRGSYLNGIARDNGFLDARGQIPSGRRQEFLRLRLNAEHSIEAGLDHADYNLRELRRRELIRDESPAAIARYAYLAHHDGVSGAAAILTGRPRGAADEVWRNVPEDQRAAYLARNGNDRNRAYRAWITDYTNQNIDVRRFMNDPAGVQVPDTRSLYVPGTPRAGPARPLGPPPRPTRPMAPGGRPARPPIPPRDPRRPQ